MATNISSISQALAGNANAIKIPQAFKADDHAAAYNTANAIEYAVAATKGGPRDTGLPTPPNSISPNLPDAFRTKFGNSAPDSPPPVDSDIDLQDVGEHPRRDRVMKSEDEEDFGSGNLTPAYLAKYHLADLVLAKGPIAIRHIIDHLNEKVPGFSQIAPPKARRLTVSALESKAGGGVHGHVEFEKVGWGRWDAKMKGQPSREARSIYSIREDQQSPPPPATTVGPGTHQRSKALQIPGSDKPRIKSRRLSNGSWTAEPSMLSRSARSHDYMDRDRDVAEYGADAMSVDGDDNDDYMYPRMARRPSISYHYQHDPPESGTDTDEEDWSQMGAEALRDGLGLGTSGPTGRRGSHFTTSLGSYSRSRSRGWSPYPSRSLPASNALSSSSTSSHQRQQRSQHPQSANLDFTGTNMESQQERDAIEALLSMGGSM